MDNIVVSGMNDIIGGINDIVVGGFGQTYAKLSN